MAPTSTTGPEWLVGVPYVFLYSDDLGVAGRFFEDTLGLAAVERDPDGVKFDAGPLLLALNVRPDAPPRDLSTLFVLHVDDADTSREQLAAAGLQPAPVVRYEIGATVDFFDPDGHYFSVYEPSAEALGWPSADRLRELTARRPRGAAPLGNRPLVYVFRFVLTAAAARAFYSEALQLPEVEVDDSVGVVKYDLGDVLLATHVADDDATVAALRTGAPARSALVLQVSDCAGTADLLRRRGVDVADPRLSSIGATARLADPDGHELYLYEPSPEARDWPSGAWLRHPVGGLSAPATGRP